MQHKSTMFPQQTDLEQKVQELWDEKKKNGTFDDNDFFWQQALEFHDRKREFSERLSYTQQAQHKKITRLWVITLILIVMSFAVYIIGHYLN